MSSSSPAATHAFGPSCRLTPVPVPEPPDGLEGIPPLNAQFFYSSPIPIDDPLSAATIVGSADSKTSKAPVRPFSPADNIALENAWLGFSSDRDRRNHRQAQRNRSPSPSLSKENAQKLAAIIAQLATKHKEKHDLEGQSPAAALGVSPCCPELFIDASAELRREFCALTRKHQQSLDHDHVIEGVMAQLSRLRSDSNADSHSAFPPKPVTVQVSTSSSRNDGASGEVTAFSASGDGQLIAEATTVIPARPPVLDDGILGKPFVRVETANAQSSSTSTEDKSPRTPTSSRGRQAAARAETRTRAQTIVRSVDLGNDMVEIPVGISRLHMVSLPVLQMKPLYWSPVNDISIVLRATWFYRDTMIPIEPAVANQLEAGYRELRPWTETWADELRSALDVGALGEEKVSHRLWPEVPDKRSKGKVSGPTEPPISSDPFCASRCFRGEAATQGSLEPVHPEHEESLDTQPEPRSYSSYHVIYKDGSAAFLLKPSLKPSAYYGRKPVSKIMKGMTVGIPVFRGFDWKTWEQVHEKKASQRAKEIKPGSALQTPGQASAEQAGCPRCQLEKERGQVTDLVLIAHGIGQKFAERVESFHFTHAVNAFRRAVNVELENPAIKSILRPGQNGIMVLPVNWRHLLKFEDGGPTSEEDKAAYAPDGFSLKDIEPPTIPAVRSMMSDVMFDIPFYMSHHKPKMIAALVGEANRVYRLWCRNNPGFTESGRVHLVGHSLGSAMAIEVLSKQPTRVPRLDLSRPLSEVRHFEFDTTNLFLLGSPAGFFLLLERAGLVPRRGHIKPGVDPADIVAKDIVADAGVFGCIAVDNIYNILAKEDPIAYLLNGTIDPTYAASLKVAYVPSTATSFFKSVGDAVRGIAGLSTTGPHPQTTAGSSTNNNNKPPTMARLPSQLELEVHDFTREDIAEKKVFLLNDNGQIDYYLRSGGGPLEIQYLNMLSAHTSYWTNQDLIRLLCVEVGRVPGRENTLASMRAVKVTKTDIRGVMIGGSSR
ncbi:DDHD domain-containing protein [Apodospora peruviana]|uniref:DDHD domain-containing protein n=1 Tax=Apodospora peruviana TaxID=516989 RepID=A0AAE0M1C8_9PEZI|nr:DDHD domain-containing protein [Apodospora peruviana]